MVTRDVVANQKIAASNQARGFETVIGLGMQIEGKVNSSDSARIEGMVTGNVSVKYKLLTGHNSRIKGNIDGEVVEIGGTVEGGINGKLVSLLATARVKGDISCGELRTEPGAVLDGRVIMDIPIPAQYTEDPDPLPDPEMNENGQLAAVAGMAISEVVPSTLTRPPTNSGNRNNRNKNRN